MDILNQLINGLNKEEVRFFKMYINRVEKTDNRKDVQLFDYIRKSGDRFSDEIIFKKLYQPQEKNSYYRLKNRLIREVNKSLTLQHFDDDMVVYIFRLLALVKFYLNKNALKPAYFFLRKAEQKANETESLELLDIIYGEYIRLTREMTSINPEFYIHRRKENSEKLNQLRVIDDILAVVTYRLKITQNLSSKDETVISLLQKTTDDFIGDPKIVKSPLFRFRIYNAISQLLLQSHQYTLLEDYLLKTLKIFNQEKLFTKNNHETKLQLLVYLVNSLYKNNKLKKSLEYTNMLHQEMKAYNQLFYDKFLFYYYNALVINYSKTDKQKEIVTLQEMEQNEKINANLFYRQFILLNFALAYFDQKEFNLSAKSFTRLQMMPDYKETDESLRMKVAVAELMTRHELNDYSTFDYKLKQFKKDFRGVLNKPENEPEKLMSEILKLMMSVNNRKNRAIELRIAQLKTFSKEEDQSGLINYLDWLQEKKLFKNKIR
ncbi:MAG TPA: hypothetical protein PLZ26_01650 [Bacteroidia bacterium]|nr:hypothetical protein [Bacteroidia bacterium]